MNSHLRKAGTQIENIEEDFRYAPFLGPSPLGDNNQIYMNNRDSTIEKQSPFKDFTILAESLSALS